MPKWLYEYQRELCEDAKSEAHIKIPKKNSEKDAFMPIKKPVHNHRIGPYQPKAPSNKLDLSDLSPEQIEQIKESVAYTQNLLNIGCRPHPSAERCSCDHTDPFTGKFWYTCKMSCCGKFANDCQCKQD